MDGGGNLYISDTGNRRIRRVDASTGTIETIAGTGGKGFSGDGGPATAATMQHPLGLAMDSTGNLFFADAQTQRVRRIDAETGIVTTVAGVGIDAYLGDGGPAVSAHLAFPSGLAIDSSDRLYIADRNNKVVRRVDTDGFISTVVGTGKYLHVGGGGIDIGDGGPATEARMTYPYGLAIGHGDDLYIVDSNNYRVRKVDLTGNQPPSLSLIGSQAVTEGATLSISLVGLDVDGDPLTYSVSGNPSGSAHSGSTF